ncbi:EAL domain-containing protein [Thalassobaculum sp.]|uniref:EAL domain-containing protein n=1 Tax=Thalassobaculum sp. TaxID=2022740 RepID=UPI0032EC528D
MRCADCESIDGLFSDTSVLWFGMPSGESHRRMRELCEVLVNRFKAGWIVDAIDGGRYTTWFQPIVAASDPDPARPFAREGLFRMSDRDGTLIPPAHVFAVAQDAGLLFSLDLVARRSAVEAAARARVRSKVFVNFNPSSVYDPAYCLRTTAAAIADLGMRPSDVVFELTETHRANDKAHLKGILAFYRQAGFGVALDDVGAGWSGLTLLHELRPDYVKIDMDLIRDVQDDPFKQTIVHHLLSIAREHGIRTIAEGIETEAEARWLRGEGVDYLQGYLYGRPAPLDAAAAVQAANHDRSGPLSA